MSTPTPTTTDLDEFGTLRAAWKAAGEPASHPYWDAAPARPSFVEPLVFDLTDGQRAAIIANRGNAARVNAANIAAMWNA